MKKYMAFSGRQFAALLSSLILTLALGSLNDLWASNVTLAWDASTDPSVVGYNIYYGGTSATYTNTVSVGGVTTATVSNLVAGSTYYFAATSLSAAGLESDFSTEISYTVPLPNQPPTLDPIANVTVNEGAGPQTVNLTGITSGATNETQTLAVTATSSNPALIPAPAVTYTSPSKTGSLSFAPLGFGNGTATIIVTVNDGGTSNNLVTRSFTVTVNPVNQPPTLNALANVTVNEGAGLQTVNLTGITSGATNENQTLAVTATSSNPALIPTPAVSYTSPSTTGSLSFTPAAYAYGSATVTVTVNDGGASNNVVTRSFTVTVNPVNQPPTLNALANVTVNQGAGLQTVNLTGITSGATNENQTLTVTANSSNPGLIPTPTISYTSPNSTGSVSFTPVTDGYGAASITVTVNDGGASNNVVARSFNVTVNALPTISSLTNLTIAVDTHTPALPFTVSDAETSADALILSASSSNPTLVPTAGVVLDGTSTNRTVTVSPAAGQIGTAVITIGVSDGSATNSTSFQLSVLQRPPPPGNFRITGF